MRQAIRQAQAAGCGKPGALAALQHPVGPARGRTERRLPPRESHFRRSRPMSALVFDACDAREESAWRLHFDAALAASGVRWEDCESAYRWGSQRRGDPRYAGRSWHENQSELSREWERCHSWPWERIKAAVSCGWERSAA